MSYVNPNHGGRHRNEPQHRYGDRMAERPDFYNLIAQNRRRTWVLMFSFFVLLALVGIAVSIIVGGGLIGVMFAVTLSFGISFSSYFSSASIALTATRAKPAAREEFGRLHNLVEEVSIAAGVPKPGVYVVHDPSPNAFATGRNADNAAVAVTTGLMDKMNRAELEGVIAHEVAHIRNGDILVMTVAVATVGAIAMISDIFSGCSTGVASPAEAPHTEAAAATTTATAPCC